MQSFGWTIVGLSDKHGTAICCHLIDSISKTRQVASLHLYDLLQNAFVYFFIIFFGILDAG